MQRAWVAYHFCASHCLGGLPVQVVALAAVEQRANAQRKALLTLMTSALQDAGAIEDKPIKVIVQAFKYSYWNLQ